MGAGGRTASVSPEHNNQRPVCVCLATSVENCAQYMSMSKLHPLCCSISRLAIVWASFTVQCVCVCVSRGWKQRTAITPHNEAGEQWEAWWERCWGKAMGENPLMPTTNSPPPSSHPGSRDMSDTCQIYVLDLCFSYKNDYSRFW